MAAPGSGFGRDMGPSGPGPGKSATPFGSFRRPSPPRASLSPPPPPPSANPTSPRPPLFGAAPVRSPSPRRPGISVGTQLLPPSFDNGYRAPARPYTSSTAFRPNESFPRLGSGQNPLYKYPDTQISQRPSSVTSLVAARNQGSVTAGIARFQDSARSNLPVTSPERDNLRNSSKYTLTSHFDAQPRSPVGYEDIYDDFRPPYGEGQRTVIPQVTRSPQSIRNKYSPVPQSTQLALPSIRNSYSPQEIPRFEEAQRPATISTGWGNRPKSPSNYANAVPHNDQNGFDNSRRGIPTDIIKVERTKRTRSPPLSPMNDLQESSPLLDDNYNRSSVSLPVSSTKTGMAFSRPNSGVHQNVPSSSDISLEAPPDKQSGFPVPKRTRSPAPSDKDMQQNPLSSPEEIEREMQAKAKRLARFKVELSEPAQRSSIIAEPKFSSVHHDLSMVQERKFIGETFNDVTGDFPPGSFDNGDVESSSNIVGLCPDMCPESERGERERKGDLDQYERLDGDRNQTSKSLAVKKYTRTAEREADLIRPMPVLLKTIDYLLSLLDQPYDDRLLGLYNFLWDRMRAVRMDLRMQHIFDVEAVKMLEQMIRLHVIAMHELCEFTKGEGFSEGFDAHLNIEQMNKTSAELFQLYDDHRKKGISIPTEKEFRGYYALLKLDKHPGYRVEPAELSLDLAKMTPEIRQTPEVLFARDVARACRTGNFIAFFRLARKASYLQACLMHAHFAKLRSQALASLHSGLQSNQGLPVAVVARWLAMEEEDIESLLHYHGFSVREYKEPYMVKEGPFLHGDRDFPTKCSELVHLKKSTSIIKDVLNHDSISSLSKGATKFQLSNDRKHDMKNIQPFEKDSSNYVSDQKMAISETTPSRSIYAPDQDLAISETISSPKKFSHVNISFRSPEVARHVEVDHKISGAGFVPWNFPVVQSSPKAAPINLFAKADHDFRNTPKLGSLSGNELTLLPFSPTSVQQKVLPVELESNGALQSSVSLEDAMCIANEEVPHVHQENGIDEVYVNEDTYINDEDEEVAEAKLKLILRLWKRRSARRKELREQRQLAAADALSSLSLGPPVHWKSDRPNGFHVFDIDQITSERRGKHRQSWSRLNVADVTAFELIKRNPNAKCLCWKIIICSQVESSDSKLPERSFTHQSAVRWLLAKILAAGTEHPDLIFSTPCLSIWRKWVPCQSNMDLICHLSVIEHIGSNNSSTTIEGASAALFLLAESIPLEPQKIQLHQLITSFPVSSRLPLLILVDSRAKPGSEDATREIINKLGLHDIDQSRVGSLSVIFLVEDKNMECLDEFFSDQRLREGLQWLASTSPLHSPVHCVETRELVLNHLNSFLERLEKSGSEVGPNQCIIALNEALDQALGEVAAAADTNPSGWPCPEVSLLDEHCKERRIADFYLPSVGWSTSARIEPILSALGKCKLPLFNDDISWLRRGCRVVNEVESQRLQLEACLIRYLTQSSNVMGDALARNEVSLLLQKHARLELQDSAYYIVPNWVMIFRRIVNWRLMILQREELSVCYVLEHVAPQTSSSENTLEEDSHAFLGYPSLDEMLEVGCADLSHLPSSSQPQISEPMTGSPIYSTQPQISEPMSGSPIYSRNQTWDTAHVDNLPAAGRANILHDNEPAFVDDGAYRISTLRSNNDTPVNFAKGTDGSEKLNRLLQQCDLLQNVLDEKLSVYF